MDSNLYPIVSETISVKSEVTPMGGNGCINTVLTQIVACVFTTVTSTTVPTSYLPLTWQYLDVFLTVHHSKDFFQVTNLMHNSFILQQYVCYTTILNMFRAARCSSSGGQIVSPQPLVSSPSVNSRTVCILHGCLQRVTIPEAVVIQFFLLRMSSVLLETCWGS